MIPESFTKIIAIVLYFIEIAVKGFASYLLYCGIESLTENTSGALYIGLSLFMVLIVLGWKSPEQLSKEPEFIEIAENAVASEEIPEDEDL